MRGEHETEALPWLWRAINGQRASGSSFDYVQVLQESRAAGVRVGWREMTWLVELAGTRTGMWTPAAFVIDFVREYLAGRNAEHLVDPAATAPPLVLALTDGDIAQNAVGLTASEELAAAMTSMNPEGRSRWHYGWRVPPVRDKPGSIGSPDLIVSAPPFGLQRARVTYSAGAEHITLDDSGEMHVLMTALDLTDDGEALVIVPNGFLFQTGAQKARPVLAQAGLHVHACVELGNAFRGTGVPCSLIAVTKRPADAVWVGRLSPHIDGAQLAANLRARKRGRTAELGRLVEWDTFESLSHIAGAERLRTLLRGAGFPPVPLKDMLRTELTWPTRGTSETIVPEGNTVYLPTFLSATVRSDAEAEGLRASGYVTLPLDQNKALAEYVALVLNSELGQAARAQASGGTTIPSLRRRRLDEMALPLPGLEGQRKVLSVRQRLKDLRRELDGIERALVDRPRDVARFESQLREVGEIDPFKAWMEVLPFPLASITWRYRADADAKDKVDHLLRFFEASAMFFAAVLLSAFDADQDLLRMERPRWGDEHGDLRLTHASFGTWTKLGAALAGSARRLLSSTENDGAVAAQMRTALAVTGPEFIGLVTGKELWKALDAVTAERNDDAHGGITGEREREEKLQRLEHGLTKLRTLTSHAMHEARLVLPREGAYRRGINQYQRALDLSGYVEAFATTHLESTRQLDADELHLIDVSEEPVNGGLKLVPLVRLQPAPRTEKKACYFYSRLKDGKAEYVSHHFERESRIPVDGEDLIAFFGRLASVREA